MNFDKTEIAIRERSTLAIIDLALHVLVDHFVALVTLWIINILPWLVIDFLLLGWMLGEGYSSEMTLAFSWAMTMLIISQLQLGTFLITQYLGLAMFEKRPDVWTVIRSAFSVSTFYWFSQGIQRTAFLALGVCLLFQGDSEDTLILCFVLLTLVVGVGILVQTLRPFVTEILMLEKTPIGAKPGTINFSTRSKSLHSFASNDLFSKAIISSLICVALVFAVHAFLLTADQVMNIRANSEYSLQPYYLIVSMWMVAGFLSIVRFLFYIDLRIRQEGWAVELQIRAEAQRLEEKME